MHMLKHVIRRRSRCPSCGLRHGVPILYGLPGPDAADAQQRGEVVLGGCIVAPDQPDRACTACGHQWKSHLGGRLQ